MLVLDIKCGCQQYQIRLIKVMLCLDMEKQAKRYRVSMHLCSNHIS